MAVTVLVAVLIIAGFLAGIRLMQSPRTALWGNRLGALAMLAALAWAFAALGRGAPPAALLFIALGAALGLALGQAVKMIHMPQTVALLNGFGGAASALVAWTAVLIRAGQASGPLFRGTSGLALGIGALTFSGSVVAVLKLQGLAFRRPPRRGWPALALRSSLLLAGLLVLAGTGLPGFAPGWVPALVALTGLAAGFFMALRVGGADMPIVISLLNSFSGIAAAVAGLAVNDIVLAGTGALVGVAGMILTRLMCRAMNRGLPAVLAGFVPAARAGEAGPAPPEAAAPPAEEDAPPKDPGELLRSARRVIVVPGYGMAVAQAQAAVRKLADALEERGRAVRFAIHPVAGRMPGHMNVLLAEVGIDYEKLAGLEEINPEFKETDLVVVVGACDVVNPAAATAEGTPISGMPILEAEQAAGIIVCNLDGNPGYSGVDNPLYGRPNVIALWGDAAETVPRLTALLEPPAAPNAPG